MSALPFMPLYVADYMSDAAHLSTLEHGAYLLLIMTYWQRGEALPANDRKLARICRVGPREWTRLKPVISEFFQVSCDNWSHSRIDRELANVHAKSLKKRKAGLARAKQMYSTCSASAQPSDTDTDTVVTLAKASDAVASKRIEFWANAKSYIGGKNPGGMIGKWLKDFDEVDVRRAITSAQAEGAVDPIPYIQRVLRKAKREADEDSFTGPC